MSLNPLLPRITSHRTAAALCSISLRNFKDFLAPKVRADGGGIDLELLQQELMAGRGCGPFTPDEFLAACRKTDHQRGKHRDHQRAYAERQEAEGDSA